MTLVHKNGQDNFLVELSARFCVRQPILSWYSLAIRSPSLLKNGRLKSFIPTLSSTVPSLPQSSNPLPLSLSLAEKNPKKVVHTEGNEGTLRASLSGTFLQTLPDLVTPLKGHSLSPRSCPATRSAPSERFGY